MANMRHGVAVLALALALAACGGGNQQQQQQAYQGTREQENNPESFADAFFKWHQRLDQIGPNSNLGDTFLDETHIDRDGQ